MSETEVKEREKLSNIVLIDRKVYRKRIKEFMAKNSSLFMGLSKTFVENKMSWGTVLESHADKYPDNIAIKFEDAKITYKEQNELINQYAQYFLSLGVKKGDVVVVLMKNRLEMPIIMSAIGKIGAISSLINSDFREKPLAHSLTIAPSKAFVIDEACFDSFNAVKSRLNLSSHQVLCFSRDRGEMSCPKEYVDLSQIVKDFPINNPTTVADVKTWDPLCYVFTSGTTGLPKTVPFPHQRLIGSGVVFGTIILDLKPGDTHYCSLPLFHSNPLTQGLGPAMYNGATFALARKFSVSNFWKDIRKHNAVSFNYIGELCRYLLNQPPSPDDGNHPIKRVAGNGLRPESWDECKKRFNIDIIGEYYGATELGAAFYNFLNFDKTSGWTNARFASVKYDVVRDEIVRNEQGYLQKVGIGEVGLLIFNAKNPSIFLGYLSKEATEKKLIRNAFKPGDLWVNTGDLVAKQGSDHVLFVDRVGDTFRWKGHNISTTEVEGVISSYDDVLMSCVFGAKIPGTDGRAGMAAIVPAVKFEDFDLRDFSEHLNKNLASYAVPIFIRFKLDLSTTSTFKLKKTILRKECYDIDLLEENVYLILPGESEYTPLTKEIYDNIQSTKYKF
jgi:fatty-acyl-CoA synthase/citronellyl-CoA synthetase